MANEKKNGTLEEIIMEMLKEGKAVRIPLKDVVDKLQENVKAEEDAQETVQPETEKSEAVPQGGQVKTVPISIHIDNLHRPDLKPGQLLQYVADRKGVKKSGVLSAISTISSVAWKVNGIGGEKPMSIMKFVCRILEEADRNRE